MRLLSALPLLIATGLVSLTPTAHAQLLLAAPGAMQALQERNHSSCETALVSQAATEDEGIAAEHRWTTKNYPGSTWREQALITDCPQGPMDRITLDTAVGERVIFFDIGSFFGHF